MLQQARVQGPAQLGGRRGAAQRQGAKRPHRDAAVSHKRRRGGRAAALQLPGLRLRAVRARLSPECSRAGRRLKKPGGMLSTCSSSGCVKRGRSFPWQGGNSPGTSLLRVSWPQVSAIASPEHTSGCDSERACPQQLLLQSTRLAATASAPTDMRPSPAVFWQCNWQLGRGQAGKFTSRCWGTGTTSCST